MSAGTVTATRRLEWDMGHRVAEHAGQCFNLHGHRYAAEITVELPLGQLETTGPATGMVVDFGDVAVVARQLAIVAGPRRRAEADWPGVPWLRDARST